MNKSIGNLFKIAWIMALLPSLYYFGLMVFFDFVVDDIFSNQKDVFNFWNFILPNIISIVLLLIYTKELLYGYTPKTRRANLESLGIFSLLIFTLLIVLNEYYKEIISATGEFIGMTIPTIMIFTAYLGIFLNRLSRVIKF